jgi:hypothetical protein
MFDYVCNAVRLEVYGMQGMRRQGESRTRKPVVHHDRCTGIDALSYICPTSLAVEPVPFRIDLSPATCDMRGCTYHHTEYRLGFYIYKSTKVGSDIDWPCLPPLTLSLELAR